MSVGGLSRGDRKLESLVPRAPDLSPDERIAFLIERCGAGPQLRRDTQTLLRHPAAVPVPDQGPDLDDGGASVRSAIE